MRGPLRPAAAATKSVSDNFGRPKGGQHLAWSFDFILCIWNAYAVFCFSMAETVVAETRYFGRVAFWIASASGEQSRASQMCANAFCNGHAKHQCR